MKLRWLTPLVMTGAIAGCGGGHHAQPPPSASCIPPIGQAHMGQCVTRHFGFRLFRGSVRYGPQGLDIAGYQGLPDWGRAKRAGLRFVWNQSSDRYYRQWNFATNWRRQRALGIPHGAYIFLRPGCGSCQGRFLADRIRAVGGQDRTALPPLLDAEVPGAYREVCSAAAAVRARLHISVVATYASPGLWDGSPTCGTLLDVANWGITGRAFAGWHSRGGSSFYIAQQWCGIGSCARFPGVSGEVDRQVDHGVLKLIRHESPAERRAKQHKRLFALYRARNRERQRIRVLKRVLLSHGCARRRHARQRLGPTCKRWFVEGDRVHVSGARHNREIAKLHREGIR